MRSIAVVTIVACILGVAADVEAARRKKAPAAGDPLEFSDENVEAAIKKGVAFLWSQQKPDGSWPGVGSYPVGPAAMAAYALLESGVSVQDERMVKALDWLKSQPCSKTYSLGLRAQAWLAAVRKGGQYKAELKKDVETLVNSTANGSYGYVSKGDRRSAGDHSNSQYGVLGAWAGALGNLEIPRLYWQTVLVHWINAQNDDGGWVYGGGGGAGNSSPTMTAAGVATLFVCFDNLLAEGFVGCDVGDKGRLAQLRIQRGLDWFDKNFAAGVRGLNLYYLYGIERVGFASGYKYFGTADWYKIAATQLINAQAANGSWNYHGAIPGTSFAILFLVRGRRPVIFNKLEFTGDWNNRPRDLAYLTQWLAGPFETDVFWQIINLKVPPEEWHDAPVLYISGSRTPTFTDDELEKLRRFVWQGGTIFSLTECQGKTFESGIREVYKRLFPDYKLTKCPKDHKIYSILYKFTPDRTEFSMISNGIRPLVVHTDRDLSRTWQLQKSSTDKNAFEAAANVYLYVTDRSFRARGTAQWPAEAQTEPGGRTVKLARIKFDGNWDPEPLAYERFSRLMAEEYKIVVEVIPAVAVEGLAKSGAQVATLTGTGKFKFTEDQQELLKEFVEDGGTLVIDAAGGDKNFAESATEMMERAFEGSRLRRLEPTDMPLAIKDMEIEKVKYRRQTAVRIPGGSINLRTIRVFERNGVIYSREDITAGLVGYPSFECDGYAPDSAFDIMRNIVMAAEERPASAKPATLPASRPANDDDQ